MSIAPFSSEQELVKYANWFLHDRAKAFRKDISICMTMNEERQHAYFPALITCIAFLDLLSGLYAGKLVGHGLTELNDYINRFMKAADYAHMDLLYEMFRHKIAHLAYPYPVFDTTTKPIFASQKQRRVTWKVCASRRDPRPIELKDDTTPLQTKTPWPVPHDSRIFVNIRRFKTDVAKSIRGYLNCLKSEPTRQAHFAKCMKVYFPP